MTEIADTCCLQSMKELKNRFPACSVLFRGGDIMADRMTRQEMDDRYAGNCASAERESGLQEGQGTASTARSVPVGFSVANGFSVAEDAGVTVKDLDRNASNEDLMVFDVSNGNTKPSINFSGGSGDWNVSWKVNGTAVKADTDGNLELPNKGKYKVVATAVNTAGVTTSSALYVLNLTSPTKGSEAAVKTSSRTGFRFSTDLKEKIEEAVSVKNISSRAKATYWSLPVENEKDVDGEWTEGLSASAGKWKVRAYVSADLSRYTLPQLTDPVMLTISRSAVVSDNGKVLVSTSGDYSETELPVNIWDYATAADDLTKAKVEVSGAAASLLSGKVSVSENGKLLMTLKSSAADRKSNVTGRIKIRFSDLTNCSLIINSDLIITPYDVITISVEQEDSIYGSTLTSPVTKLREDGSVVEDSSVRYTYCAKGSSRMTSVVPKTAGDYVVQADYSSGSGSDRTIGSAAAEFRIEKLELRIEPDLKSWTEGMPSAKLNDTIKYTIADGNTLAAGDRFGAEPFYRADAAYYTGIENDCPVVVANKDEALASLTNNDSYDITFDEDQTVRVLDEGLVIKFGQNAYTWGDTVTASVLYNRSDVTAGAVLSHAVNAAAGMAAGTTAGTGTAGTGTTAAAGTGTTAAAGTGAAAGTNWVSGLPSEPGSYTVKAVWGSHSVSVPLEIAKKSVIIKPKDAVSMMM